MQFKINQSSFIILAVLVIVVLISAGQVWAGAISTATLEIRVNHDDDDAEEMVGSGVMDRKSSDLELVRESTDQIIGIRFEHVKIPKGSTITNAYILFTTDETDSEPTDLTIWGESSKDANRYTDTINDISSRLKTGAVVDWSNVSPWGSVGETGVNQQSPDLSAIVQEIIDIPDWAYDKPIAFIIEGSGKRVAESFDGGGATKAPLLHIEYTSNVVDVQVSSSDDDAEQRHDTTGAVGVHSGDLDFRQDRLWGVRFLNVAVPQGAEITKAYIEFTADEVDTGFARVRIDIEEHDDPPIFLEIDNNLSDRNLSGDPIDWNPIPDWNTVDELHRTPDLSALVQKIVGRPGWTSGNAMVFIGEGMNSNRAAISYDQDPALAPKLHIEYGEGEIGTNEPIITVNTTSLGATCYQGNSPGDVGFTLSNTGTDKLQYNISDDAVWVTLSTSGGDLETGLSTDITVSFNTPGLPVGTHEATILITDPDALNNPVEIQVSVTIFETPDEMTCGNVPLYTENLVSPAILILLDVSGSMKTKMEVSPTGNPQTPNLAPIVQEIIDRPGWVAGNAMAFMIDGGGRRTAKSYNGDSSAAPLLHVEYNDGSDHTIEIRVNQKSDDAEERLDNASVDLNNNDLEMIKDNSGNPQIVGIRFQNVDIPKGATITNAYIEFTIDESDSETTALVIYGEDMDDPPTYANSDNNISNRKKTTAATAWNSIDEWQGVTKERRVDIGKEVISDLVKDRAISWGYGTWCNKKPWKEESDYTLIHVGTKQNTDAHQAELQAAIAATDSEGGTPFSFSIEAAKNYFTGVKADKDGLGDFYVESDCQPKFLIDITDGMGNTGSTVANTRSRTQALADAGVTSVGVGFGLDYEDAEQLYEMAKWANIEGNASDTDEIYALHEEIAGVAEPFFAYNKKDLIDALNQITESVKGAIFHGSAPAPTTSADLGDTVVVAHFDASRWIGDVKLVTKDTDKASPTYGMWVEEIWQASGKIPVTRSLWTIDPMDVAAKSVIKYDESTLADDRFACFQAEPIGDIINSTPVVVGYPPYSYPFDAYTDFKYNTSRDTMIYIGANDGSLHAFDLVTGAEQWAFVPKSMHAKLEAAGTDPVFDRCAVEYCHQYYVDGSPIVGDVYAKFDGISKEWRTVLVIGEREGGEAYFALDVTSGKQFSDVDPTKFLWEFTDDQLGQTWSDPAIDRVAIDGIDPSVETAWGVFFGSGYMPIAAEQATKQAYLYGVHAHDASDLWKNEAGDSINRITMSPTYLNYKDPKNGGFAVGQNIVGDKSGSTAIVAAVDTGTQTLTLENAVGVFQHDEQLKVSGAEHGKAVGTLSGTSLLNDALASPLTVDFEADYIADRIYVGNLYGNMYRVSNIGKYQVPEVTTLFTYNNSSPYVNPIRAKADFAYSETDGEIWVYFGSGRYETQADKLDNNQQYFFGLKDDQTSTASYTPAGLATLQAKFAVTVDKTVRYVDGTNDAAVSWKMQLYEGTFPDGPLSSGTERVISRPLAVAGMVLFTTFIPDENICAGSGETWVFAVDYKSGLAATEPVFDLNGDGKFDDNDKVEVNGELVVPIGIMAGRGQGSPPVLHKDTLFITTTGDGEGSGGGEEFFAQKVNLSQQKVKVEAWREN